MKRGDSSNTRGSPLGGNRTEAVGGWRIAPVSPIHAVAGIAVIALLASGGPAHGGGNGQPEAFGFFGESAGNAVFSNGKRESAAEEEPDTAPAVTAAPEVEALLRKFLGAEQLAGIGWAFRNVGKTTLGPQPPTDAQAERMAGPEKAVQLEIGDGIAGAGTPGDPHIGAIAAFLEKLEETNVTVAVPSGHYVEWGLEVPEGVRLAGGNEAVLRVPEAAEDRSEGRLLVASVGKGSALTGFELDGRPATERRIDAVRVAGDGDGAVVANNHIHHFTGQGVNGAARSRHEAADDVLVFGNRIEYLGFSGVRARSHWTVAGNRIRHTGILRTGGMGGGGDGIITTAHQRDAVFENNLIVHSRRPDPKAVFGLSGEEWRGKDISNNARHGLATQKSEGIIMRGNLVVALNGVRMAVALADESNRNEVVGNVFLQLLAPGAEGTTWLCIVANGAENRIAGNAILGFENAFNMNERKRPERIYGNVAEHNFVRTIGSAVRIAGPSNPIRNNRMEGNVDYDSIVKRRLDP